MDNNYVIKDGKIIQHDGLATTGTVVSEAAIIEAYGQKALDEINRFGGYLIKK